jgi:dTDP-4-dehydrorhamnose 3,5-epimerase
MIFHETSLPGAFVIEPERNMDERGYFARTWCANEFAALGLCKRWEQCSISFNKKRGTLRGLHYQEAPHQEAKLVRCTRGGIYDVTVDIRRESPTFGTWVAVELTAENGKQLFIPKGCAHGFQTMLDDTEVHYQISECYCPEAARGIRWDDPRLTIPWPIRQRIVSRRDSAFPDFDGIARLSSPTAVPT